MPNDAKEYTAFKLKGQGGWLWFKTTAVTRENGRIIAKGGWCKGGGYTEMDIKDDLVEGEIVSETVGYNH